MLKKESAQLRQQLDARNPLRGAPMRSTPIVTFFRLVLQTLVGCIQVMAFMIAVWIGCGGLEWLYHKAPILTFSGLAALLVAIVIRELIYQWRD